MIQTPKQLIRSLIFGGAILLWSPAAPAAPVINTLGYSFRAAMTNTAIAPSARGTVLGNLTARDATDNQRLTIKFDADALDVALPVIPPQAGGNIVQDVRLADPVT